MLAVISDKTVGGIRVVVDDAIFDGLPGEDVMRGIVTQCATTFCGFIVTTPAVFGQHLRFGVETPVHPRQAISQLKSGVLQGAHESVVCACATEHQGMTTGFEDAQRLDGPLAMPLLLPDPCS